MKSAVEENLKEVAEATMREKGTTLEAAVERARDVERARALSKHRVAEL